MLLRLPLELKELFSEWLEAHFPDRAARVLGRMRDCRDGQLYVSDWGTRMKGTGEYSKLLAQRFAPRLPPPRPQPRQPRPPAPSTAPSSACRRSRAIS